jgi:hypothetical protein
VVDPVKSVLLQPRPRTAEQLPSLFVYNALVVISDGMLARIGLRLPREQGDGDIAVSSDQPARLVRRAPVSHFCATVSHH